LGLLPWQEGPYWAGKGGVGGGISLEQSPGLLGKLTTQPPQLAASLH